LGLAAASIRSRRCEPRLEVQLFFHFFLEIAMISQMILDPCHKNTNTLPKGIKIVQQLIFYDASKGVIYPGS
jgi:hypothetical protein